MSTIEDNKRIARRWLDLVTQGRVEELCAMTAPTWTMHGGPPSLPVVPDGIRALFGTFGRIEQAWSIEDVIATQLLSMNDHRLDYETPVMIARAVREQINWEALRRRTLEVDRAEWRGLGRRSLGECRSSGVPDR